MPVQASRLVNDIRLQLASCFESTIYRQYLQCRTRTIFTYHVFYKAIFIRIYNYIQTLNFSTEGKQHLHAFVIRKITA